MHLLSAPAAASLASMLSLTAASTLTPPVLPLIVRNPYLSTWLANAREEPWSKWPIFYTGQSVGFSVLASVPETSTVYPLLGRAHDALGGDSKKYNVSYPTYLGVQYDASTTNLSYAIRSPKGPSYGFADLTLSFLSPITPTSTLRQAIPASYLTIHVEGDFDISVYVDLNGQWVSGDRNADIVWALDEPKIESKDETKLKTFRVKRKHQLHFTEHGDQAEWGELHFTGPADVNHECGTSGDLRQHFAKTHTLKNQVDNKFRRIMDAEPVFAFSKTFNFSSNSTNSTHTSRKSDNLLLTIAHLQDPVTQFASARGLTQMRPLWKSYFYTDSSLTSFHYHDYPHAFSLATNYTAELALSADASTDTSTPSYVDLLTLTARQVLGATSFSGTPDNPLIFLKEISSNGNSQTIDVIFPSFPFFLYTQPRWLAYVLEPLLEHMGSGQYPNDYAMHDLGAHFPNLTGHPDGRDEYMPVEECGDILIMGLALVHSLIHGTEEAGGGVRNSPWSSLGKAKLDVEIETLDATPFALPQSLETREGVWGLDDQWGGVTSKHQARKWLARNYGLWKQWTRYLVDFSLYPENQLCTDDFAGWLPLMTNLALKGIIGIKAMSELAVLMDEKDDVKYYRNISESYIKVWEKEGISRDGGRAKLAYNWYGSWTTLYSLFADGILCFHPHSDDNSSTSTTQPAIVDAHEQQQQQQALIPAPLANHQSNFISHKIYTRQSAWYATVTQKFGLPLDSRHLYAKSDWALQAAAVAFPATRALMLEGVAKWVNETATDLPLTDLYRTEDDGGFGAGNRFTARPVVGSFFALVVVGRVCGGGLLGSAFGV